ncbi:helix-turn-helix domain-containing protein [Nocardia sp. NPDC005366]|uniref:TetR/AcrR family transcriptional regulator n=1 Tax=Nocardia sp. NPDC005366 TaxID=3156878 RepID=UPI0033B087E6
MRLRAEERRRLLVDAAFVVMARDGVSAATTRAICTEAGMPQSAFHYAFRSKEELLRELTEAVVGAQTSALTDLDVSSGSLRAVMRTAMEQLLAATVTEPGRQAVLYELTLLDLRAPDDPGSLGRWQYRLYTDRAATLLESVTERFDVHWRVPVETLARMVATAVDGTVLAWLADRDTALAAASLQALAEAVVSLAVETNDPASPNPRGSQGPQSTTRSFARADALTDRTS